MKFMKKILALALIVVSVMAINVPAFAATTGIYNRNAVNLRSSMGGVSLGLVSEGATCDILDSRTDSSGRAWYKVKITSHTKNDPDLYGYTGWSWQEYIDITGGTTPSNHPQTKDEAFGSYYLQKGSTGNYVRNLQLCLHTDNYLVNDSDIDGIFGENTRAALIEFQLDNLGILGPNGNDGIAGPKVKTLMWDMYSTELKTKGYK